MRSSRSSSLHRRLHCSRASRGATTSGRGTTAGMTCQTLGSIATHGSGLPGKERKVTKDARAASRARMAKTGAASRKGARALTINSSAELLMGARSVFLTMLRDVMALVGVCTSVVSEDVARRMLCGSTTRPCPPRLHPPRPLATDLRHFVCLYLFAGAPRDGDIRWQLEQLCKQRRVSLDMKEFDFVRDPLQDLASPELLGCNLDLCRCRTGIRWHAATAHYSSVPACSSEDLPVHSRGRQWASLCLLRHPT